MNKIDNAIKQWLEVAKNADKMAELEISRSSSPNAYINQADDARRTVKALEIEKETGVAVCSCHFKPFPKGNTIVD